MQPVEDDARENFARLYPQFFARVKDFPDFQIGDGLTDAQIETIEKNLDFTFPEELKSFLRNFYGISINGLSMRADRFGTIVMPSSEGLVIGEFYLNNPGDRLLMLPSDSSIYYLENRNGAITRLAANMEEFFEKTLLKYL